MCDGLALHTGKGKLIPLRGTRFQLPFAGQTPGRSTDGAGPKPGPRPTRLARYRSPWNLLLLLLLFAGRALAVSAIDDTGSRIALEGPAERIVSLSPHATELLFAAGAGGKIVGTVSYSDYPPAAKEIPRVGGYKALDMERILALRPDLLVAWQSGNGPDVLARLESMGLKVFATEPRRLEQVPETIEALGQLAGTSTIAEEAAREFRKRLQALTKQYRDRPPVTVFYEVWNRPLMSIGGRHFISNIIERCGGRNIFQNLEKLAPTITEESVIAANPQVIIASGMGEERPEWLDAWRRWPSLAAVIHGQLRFIPPDYLQRPTPRALDGAERLCRILEQARKAYAVGRK